ncbi:alternative ribosome rescue aminoacyl-tRNA hydrolase ArfB [Pseudemcibacter aquimaris]|uniref:alternative ribosome rescue aminoacyl-tRNA hydrolase ArfB n=1 Tax=Pseudemcibacter aquimaris TaxID=2857064 RepID=UPI002012E9FD|nr:alternative ribosome rescue aminoacyl-tRNA hydrolase ArfB [Pseudemcibacter aquimaris]MCC3861701.1 aminoacyl-tRNA hydrolase [Pseudemcibacter aquimaris]WDU58471.1 aminoacyl-tRNA hydrolase [Pseudemcibacter aquimaris]
MIKITNSKYLDEEEIEFNFIRSPGAGGQHVNKVESAVQIRFDARNCDFIDDAMFTRLRGLCGSRMTMDGVIILTVSDTRSQVRNREIAIERLVAFLKQAAIVPKVRKKTKPSKAAKERRLTSKKQRSSIKKLRSRKITD